MRFSREVLSMSASCRWNGYGRIPRALRELMNNSGEFVNSCGATASGIITVTAFQPPQVYSRGSRSFPHFMTASWEDE